MSDENSLFDFADFDFQHAVRLDADGLLQLVSRTVDLALHDFLPDEGVCVLGDLIQFLVELLDGRDDAQLIFVLDGGESHDRVLEQLAEERGGDVLGNLVAGQLQSPEHGKAGLEGLDG